MPLVASASGISRNVARALSAAAMSSVAVRPSAGKVATPIEAEARYLKQLYGGSTPVVYTGVCVTEGGDDVDAAITLAELGALLQRRGVRIADQPVRSHPALRRSICRRRS